MGSHLILEGLKPVTFGVPKSLSGVGLAAVYKSMKEARRLLILAQAGAWASATPALTLTQATSAAGAGAKALNIDRYWYQDPLTAAADVWTEVAVANTNTFNLANAANRLYALEVYATQLDVTNGFAYVGVAVADPSAADFLAVLGLLEMQSIRYPTKQNTAIA